MSENNSMFAEHSEHSFFGDCPNNYIDYTIPKDLTKGSSNAENVYES